MMVFCQRVARMKGYNLRDLSFKAGRNGNHCILDIGDTHPSFKENGVTAEDNTVEVSVTQAEIAMVGWMGYPHGCIIVKLREQLSQVEFRCLHQYLLPRRPSQRVLVLMEEEGELTRCPNFMPAADIELPEHASNFHVIPASEASSIMADKQQHPAVVIAGKGPLPWERISRQSVDEPLRTATEEYVRRANHCKSQWLTEEDLRTITYVAVQRGQHAVQINPETDSLSSLGFGHGDIIEVYVSGTWPATAAGVSDKR